MDDTSNFYLESISLQAQLQKAEAALDMIACVGATNAIAGKAMDSEKIKEIINNYFTKVNNLNEDKR